MTHLRIGRTAEGFIYPPGTPFDVEAFLAAPLTARLATAGPTVRPVWFLWEDTAFWILIGPWSALERRLAADPTFELVVDVCDLDTGMTRQVIGTGTGSVQAFDSERGRRKLVRYLGMDRAAWDPRFRLPDEDQPTDLRWARLEPRSLLVRDSSFRISPREDL